MPHQGLVEMYRQLAPFTEVGSGFHFNGAVPTDPTAIDGSYKNGDVVAFGNSIYVWYDAFGFVEICGFSEFETELPSRHRTFVEENYDRLMAILRPQEMELSADDTKELDEFLSSFVRK